MILCNGQFSSLPFALALYYNCSSLVIHFTLICSLLSHLLFPLHHGLKHALTSLLQRYLQYFMDERSVLCGFEAQVNGKGIETRVEKLPEERALHPSHLAYAAGALPSFLSPTLNFRFIFIINMVLLFL